MDKYLSAPQVTGSVTAGAVAAWFGQVWQGVALAVGFIVADYISGMLAAGRSGELNSAAATKGLYKKAGFIMLIVTGFALDASFSWLLASGLRIQVPFDLPFGLIICAWTIFTEAISIMENLYRLEIPVPEWLLKFLKIAKDGVGKNV